MIVSIIILLFSAMVGLIGLVLPNFQLMPDGILEAIDFFALKILNVLSILPAGEIVLLGIAYILEFAGWFGLFIIIRKIINWIRGADGI